MEMRLCNWLHGAAAERRLRRECTTRRSILGLDARNCVATCNSHHTRPYKPGRIASAVHHNSPNARLVSGMQQKSPRMLNSDTTNYERRARNVYFNCYKVAASRSLITLCQCFRTPSHSHFTMVDCRVAASLESDARRASFRRASSARRYAICEWPVAYVTPLAEAR